MNSRIPTFALAVVAAAVSTAFAQATTPSTSAPPPLFNQVTAAEYGTPPAPAPNGPLNFVSEPTASLSSDQAPGADVGKQLVEQINADESLKGSKITVVPEDGAVTLVGTTKSYAQAQKIAQLAAEKVGVAKVTNAIRDSEVRVEPVPQQTAQADNGDSQAAGAQPEAQAENGNPQSAGAQPQAQADNGNSQTAGAQPQAQADNGNSQPAGAQPPAQADQANASAAGSQAQSQPAK
jgi:hypothetical protein